MSGTGFIRGVLTRQGAKTFVREESGSRQYEGEIIWSGYIAHWEGKRVRARPLPQKDYETGRPIIIMWPDMDPPSEPFVELYYNERLIKYPASRLGHIAINVSGEIFNFSHLLNENEVIAPEEYFYRPALGEFAPHPETGMFSVDDPQRPYFDKFGRRFMRTIHVLRIFGINANVLSEYYRSVLREVHAAPPDPKDPATYSGFSVFTRSCVTIIRDGLKKHCSRSIGGLYPRDLFVNTVYTVMKNIKKLKIKIELFKMEQLKVPEAPYSTLTPLMNPLNRLRARRLPDD